MRRCVRLLLPLLALLTAVLPTAPAVAAPAPAAAPKPAPTSAKPKPAPLPPAGRAPDGSVVGGEQMAGRGLVTPPGARSLPKDLTARGWVLADLDSGAVLAARDPHGKYLPASTLKLLTALTLIPRLNKRKVVVASTADCNIEGSRVGLVPRGKYTVDLLFQALLMMSGNDAANALARAAGGVPSTVRLMNEQARRLQAFDTHAATPSGLDGPGQSISAYDLALIARAAFALPDFRRYDRQLRGKIPAQPPKYKAFEIANQNELLRAYPGAIGGKTGFTDAARHTYVGAAARHGRRLVVAFVHAERSPLDHWQQAARLLDWGFGLRAGTPPVGRLVNPGDPIGTAAPGPTASAGPGGPAPQAQARPGAGRSGGGLPVLPLAGGLGGAGVLAAAGVVTARRRGRRNALKFRQPRRWGA